MKSQVGLYAAGALVWAVALLGCGDLEPRTGNDVPVVIGAPQAPTGVVATEGNAESTVSWTPPADTGGRALSGYIIHVLRDGAEVASGTSTEPTFVARGLTNGATYQFAVTARTDFANSPRSEPSGQVVPRAIPDAPGNVAVEPGNREVTVTWAAPTDNGMPLAGYTVVLWNGQTQVATQNVTGTSATFEGLTNGTTYSVTVTARNAVVPGPTSAAVAVTPRTVPAAPVLTVGPSEEGIHHALCRWTEPDTGGAYIMTYTLEVYEAGVLVRRIILSDTQRSVSLTHSRTYTFTIYATNEAGNGPTSEPVTATVGSWD